MQQTGVPNSGARSIATLLDQVVFGDLVTSYDLWQEERHGRLTLMICCELFFQKLNFRLLPF